jgi:hypothetical protein
LQIERKYDKEYLMKKPTDPPWELVVLNSPAPDWTSTSFVIRAPQAPGGLAVLIGTGDKEEERANAELILEASTKRKLFRPAVMAALRSIVLEYARQPGSKTEVWEDILSGDVIHLGELLNVVTQL